MALKLSHRTFWRVNFKYAGYLEATREKSRPNKDDALRACACIIDYLFFFDENTTVNGVALVADLALYTLKMETYIPLEDRRDFIQTWQVRRDTWRITIRYDIFTCAQKLTKWHRNKKIRKTINKNQLAQEKRCGQKSVKDLWQRQHRRCCSWARNGIGK